MLGEIMQGSVKVICHRDQPFGASELRMALGRSNGHDLHGLLIIRPDQDLFALYCGFDQSQKPALGFLQFYLIHVRLPFLSAPAFP